MDRGYERLVLIEKPWGQEGEKLVEPEHPHDGRLQDEVGDEDFLTCVGDSHPEVMLRICICLRVELLRYGVFLVFSSARKTLC